MIRLSKSVIGEEEFIAVKNVLCKEFLGMGDEVMQFETELSEFLGSPTLCVNTGTAALQVALQAAGVKLGDELLVQSLTYVACFQAITACGAIPIACEVESESLTIDLIDAKEKITDRTKVIMPVHYTGSPGNLSEIYNFAKNNNLRVVEDAAHAFGSKYNDSLIGSIGDIICFSFDGIKNITCGEGGAIVTRDEKVINLIKDIRLLGVEKDSDNRYLNKRTWDFDVKQQGWRYHMSNIMAAIGSVQLRKFEIFKNRRQDLAIQYVLKLKKINQIRLLDIDYNNINPHIFVIKILNGERDILKEFLEKNSIQTGIHWKPNHLLSFFKSKSLKKTELIYAQILTLPLHPDMTSNDIEYITDLICKFFLKNNELTHSSNNY